MRTTCLILLGTLVGCDLIPSDTERVSATTPAVLDIDTLPLAIRESISQFSPEPFEVTRVEKVKASGYAVRAETISTDRVVVIYYVKCFTDGEEEHCWVVATSGSGKVVAISESYSADWRNDVKLVAAPDVAVTR